MGAPSSTFNTSVLCSIYAVKIHSVNFLFLAETPASCILDYTLYNHEKGKCNALEK